MINAPLKTHHSELFSYETAVEAETSGMTAGQSQALWTIISTAMAQMESPQAAELARLDKR